MSAMTAKYEIFSLNFGPLFERDPLQLSLASRVTFLTETPPSDFEQLFRTIAPDAVVLAECPLAGSMRKAYEAAGRCGIPQFAVDNYYGRCSARLTQTAFWRIRRWLLLGVVSQPGPARWSWGREVVPPLLPPINDGGVGMREGIVVMGYDRATLEMAFEILLSIRQRHQVHIFMPDSSPELLAGLDFSGLSHACSFHREPEESELYRTVARSRLVLGKAGFQQIVESVYLGTPIACRISSGGVMPFLMPRSIRPHMQPIQDTNAVPAAMPRILDWLNNSQGLLHGKSRDVSHDAIRFAASRLEAMIDAR
jgi:hypothetical protein